MSHIKASPQIEADKRLLKFDTYEDYLDSLAISEDKCYLQSVAVSRNMAELGYRNSGETLSREQFEKRLAAVVAYMFPSYRPYESSSEGMVEGNPFQQDLALRERSNRVGILTTIIFLRYFTENGFEISGYIDYADRLVSEDLKPFFTGKKKLAPKKTDLGYYRWRTGKVISNDSLNYKVVMSEKEGGLIFQNRFDRMFIFPEPSANPGANTTRKRVYCDEYELIILFDHVVRQRI